MTHSIHIFNLVTVCKMRTANSNQHYFLNQLKISANHFEEKVAAGSKIIFVDIFKVLTIYNKLVTHRQCINIIMKIMSIISVIFLKRSNFSTV